MRGRVIILCGPSGSGKTTLVNIVSRGTHPNVVKAPKYSDRPVRLSDDQNDDIIHDDWISLHRYDLVYCINNNTYGIRLKKIEDLINNGQYPIIVVSDFRVIRDMKDYFRSRSIVIFISSPADESSIRRMHVQRNGIFTNDTLKQTIIHDLDMLNCDIKDSDKAWLREKVEHDWSTLSLDTDTIEARIKRLKVFYIKYSENILLFDHAILNHSLNKPEQMTDQLEKIIRDSKFKQRKRFQYPPLFLITGQSGPGINRLTDVLYQTARDRISIITEETNFLEIDRNIRLLRPQYCISSIEQIIKFREQWPAHCVPLYCWNTETEQQNPINYLENITLFDHVLLSIGNSDSNIDQMFSLIDYYETRKEEFIYYSCALASLQCASEWAQNVSSGILFHC